MKTTTVTDAKNHLSALIDQVRAGETITILDRGTPVARLEPVVSDGEHDARMKRLVRTGVVRPGTSSNLAAVLADLPAPPTSEESVLDALLEERRTGR